MFLSFSFLMFLPWVGDSDPNVNGMAVDRTDNNCRMMCGMHGWMRVSGRDVWVENSVGECEKYRLGKNSMPRV